jgi:hypothetical protein
MAAGFPAEVQDSRAEDTARTKRLLGHSDMESTMRYLKPSRSQQLREKVNEIFA